MRFLPALAISALTALSASACSAGGAGEGAPSPATPPTATVLVENSNWADMTVYVEHSGARTRLGTVTTATRRLFRLPPAFAGIAATLRFVADPLGGTDVYTTMPVQVAPGQRVNFVIENQVGVSSVWVSNR